MNQNATPASLKIAKYTKFAKPPAWTAELTEFFASFATFCSRESRLFAFIFGSHIWLRPKAALCLHWQNGYIAVHSAPAMFRTVCAALHTSTSFNKFRYSRSGISLGFGCQVSAA